MQMTDNNDNDDNDDNDDDTMTDNNDNDDNDDNDDDTLMLDSLFICEEYKEIDYEIKGISNLTKDEVLINQKLLASTMSCTDHDLTGQVVWPASLLLSTFLLCYKDSIFNENKNNIILELGSGCGLAGYVAANLLDSNEVFVTDGNDIVVRLLQKTKATYNYENVFVKKLLWGIKSEIQSLGKHPNIIIGADVLLWPNHTRALLLTIKWLMISSYLHDNSNIPVSYISYIVRANTTTTLLFKSADELGLKIDTIPLDFLPVPEPSCLQTLEKMILKITLLNTDNIDESSDTIEEETVKELGFASAPC